MSNTSQIESVDLTATPLVTISGHEDKIWGIAYIPQASGKRVVTCSHDKTVRIWDAESGEQEGTSMEHELGVAYGLAVTRDGQRILSGGVDKRIDVWDVETHELIEEWESHTGSILSITLSPDDRLAASGDSDGKLVIWEIKEGSGIKHSIETGTGWVLSICFSPNGEKIACAARKSGNYTIQIFDVESGELILGSIYHEDWVRCVIWSLDGTKLFSASNDHTIRCWNSETAEPVGQPWTGHMVCVTWLSLSPDGKRLASTSLDQTVRFWDAHSGDPVGRPLQHDDHLMRVTFSPSGEFVASGMVNGKISVWRVPWWDDSQLEKELHKSLLDLPAVPVPKILSNGQQQRELDYLDLPTNRRPIASSHRPPADSATGHVQRFWRRLVTRHSASSPAQQALEHHPIRHRRFWKLSVGTPVTEVAAGHAKNGVVVGRSVIPRRKKKRQPQAPPSSSAADTSSHAEPSGSTSIAGPSNSQAGPSSNAVPVGRISSFAPSNAGSDDSWDDMDCGEQCIDYFCFGPRDNRERFRPWKKKSRAVIEAEEQAKKEKKKNARRHRKSKAPKAQNAVRPLHHHCDVPQANRINVVSPTSHDAAHAMREPPGDDQLDGAVPQRVVLQLKDQKEQIEQLRLQLDDAVGAKRKADAEKDLLEKEVKELRSTVHDSHKSLHRTEAGSSSSLAEPTSVGEPSASQGHIKAASPAPHDVNDATGDPFGEDNQLDGAVPRFALQLQEQIEQLRQQVDYLVAVKRNADAERNLLEMEVNEFCQLQDPHTRTVSPVAEARLTEPSSDALPPSS